jgi:hypothetical protein
MKVKVGLMGVGKGIDLVAIGDKGVRALFVSAIRKA